MASAETVEKTKSFGQDDFDKIAEHVYMVYKDRKEGRKTKEEQWKEIDRQLGMKPKLDYKFNPLTGFHDKVGVQWMPELELPLQSQTLEILSADARRIMFPDNGPWFRAHALVTKEYLDEVNIKGLVAGEETDIEMHANQDNIDKLVEGIMGELHEQQGFFAQIDRFNTEAFKYGTGVGRVRKAKKSVYIQAARGMVKEEVELPVFFATSLKETYLDPAPQFVMSEGHYVGPATISYKRQKLADIMLAAKNGETDPEKEDGGWMPSKIKKIKSDGKGLVEVLRWEGDMVIDTSADKNLYIPGLIVTCLKGEGKPQVVRLSFREKPFSSYVTQPYHLESVTDPYGTSPLMKGRPLQSAASDTFCRLIQAAILNTEPPIKYDPEDPAFASTGGPIIEPRALWASSGDIEPVKIGDTASLLQAYAAIVAHYSDVTGMHAPRIGQQTVSHTTAYAKEAELSRGQVRTVDYANSMLDGAMSKILDMQFSYLKDVWREDRNIWIPDYGGFARVFKDAIPDACVFEIFGSAGPAEERARLQEQMQAIQQVIQIDMLQQQSGMPGEPLNLDVIKRTILKEAGFSDVDVIFSPQAQAAPSEAPVGPDLPGATQGNPGAVTSALQALAFSGGQ